MEKNLKKQLEKKSSEEKILTAAMKEFSQYGFEGARVDRIAGKAKINKAMIYYHFKSKEALYEKVLLNTFGGIYNFIDGIIAEEKEMPGHIYELIGGYVEYIGALDIDFVRIMLRELSSGGKYVRKILMPNMMLPILEKVRVLIDKGKKKGVLKDLDPYYTVFQVVGSVVFFNTLRSVIAGTDLAGTIFKENYLNDFKDNLLNIFKSGIEKGDR